MNVGTGTHIPSLIPKPLTGIGRLLNASSIGPAVNHYETSFSGEKMWRELLSILTTAGREPSRWCRRFDLRTEEKLPDLADTQAMNSLAIAAQSHFATDPAIDDLAMAVLASNFYLELRRVPLYESRCYVCYSRILSRVSVAHSAFVSFFQRLDSLGARFVVEGRLLNKTNSTVLVTDSTGNFCMPVRLCVQDLDQAMSIQVKFGNGKFHDISANRTSVRSLIQRQRLHWVGKQDYTSRLCSKSATIDSMTKRRPNGTLKGTEQGRKRRKLCYNSSRPAPF